MTTDERITAARRQLAEAEAAVQASMGALASARACLITVEEENRSLRREALQQNMKFYTESEFAHELKVSAATIARQRKAGKLKYTLIGGQVRYTSLHLAQFAERQEQMTNVRSRSRRDHLRSVPTARQEKTG